MCTILSIVSVLAIPTPDHRNCINGWSVQQNICNVDF